ncbi:MAG: MBL fold metallo-hydrolase [Solirubrobacteraceae bacterium]|nr:MBL fold metallo-hydrolase [Solirubrobacteraceae bacterium]
MSAGPEQIDVRHLGRERVICCLRQDDVIVDPGPEVSLDAVVEALSDSTPRAILLTHIHLDHAGGVGALVRRWPGVEVWVHERGAPHLVDPSRLIASATRLYGEEMASLWGEIVPVPQANLRVLRGGEVIGAWRVAYTPGHAQHHVAYLHEPTGTAFCGDVAGVRIADGPVLAPTPPPDIDLEAWERSIGLIERWAPVRLALTHFGVHEGVGEHLATLRERLALAGERSRSLDARAFEAELLAWLGERVDRELLAAYVQAMPPDALHAGLALYWRRRAQADGASGGR